MSDTIDYQKIEREFVDELNKFRANPQSMIQLLEITSGYLKDKILWRPDEIPIVTVEGISAINEAIEFVQNITEPLSPLINSEFLNQAARAHCNDVGYGGANSHVGSDGSSVFERVERFCEWTGSIVQTVDLGSKSGLSSLISLIIDDGVESRGNRLNLIRNDIKYIGVASGFHKDYRVCVISVYAKDIREKNKPFHSEEMINDIIDQSKRQIREPPTEKEIKNQYQLEDEDAPDNTISVKTIKQIKYFSGKQYKVNKKIYTLSDRTQRLIEVEDFQA